MSDQELVGRFKALEKVLGARHPKAREEAEALGENIADPRNADADAIWAHVWNKPLYAHTKVALADAAIVRLAPYMADAWREWGDERGDFRIARIGAGRNATFQCTTPLAQTVRQETRIALHRLFAIQGAAQALRMRETKSVTPYADLMEIDVGEIVPILQQEMGLGWGPITVLHFLTDLGIACKPDLHLVRTVRSLGMTLDLRDRKMPNLADAIMINRRVRCLLEALDGAFNPARFRYLDKTLMDISWYGLI